MNGFPLLPAPAMLLDHLLGLMFIVHVIFMNYVVAAPFVIAWYLLAKGESGRQRARWMAAAQPVAFTFAINFGVAALLFIQALFAERFFTANIILGSAWLAVIGLLIAAFYGAYAVKQIADKPQRSPRLGGLIALVVAALVWSVGLIMISNYFISTSRDEWTLLHGNPRGVLANITFLPRSLHFLMGSFAVTGFWMIWISWWKEKRGEVHQDLQKLKSQGSLLAAAATALQVVVGIWFVLWLPQETWDKLLSGSFVSIVWMSGVAAGLLMLASLLIANFSNRPALWTKVSTGLLLYTLIGMVAGRDIVRLAAFGADFRVADLPAEPQAGAMKLFALLLVLGLIAILSLFWLIWRARKPTS